MIRCGYGSDDKSQDDSSFETNVKNAEKAKLPWGVYLYSYAVSKSEAKSEAEHVKRLLKGKKPTLPVAFDMEDADGYKSKHGAMRKTVITDICKTFLSEIKKAGYYPMLYTSLSWIGDYISTDVTDKYDLWIAQWNKTCDYKGKNLGMWQYGGEVNYLESNSISGVGTIDKDKCFKDYPAIIKNGGYNNWPKPSTKVLDKDGFKKDDKSLGVLALKELLVLARREGITTIYLKSDKNFTAETQRAVNQALKKLGYKPNGIAGEKFIKKLTKQLIGG
ncbi:MAG: glycoside hydrolase [Ruminococcus sp.]|nr:glycoside hydrolase [Ruminococcus sp.]